MRVWQLVSAPSVVENSRRPETGSGVAQGRVARLSRVIVRLRPGSGGCRMIRDGRNSHLWPEYRAQAGEAWQIKDYGIAATHSQPEIWRRLIIGHYVIGLRQNS